MTMTGAVTRTVDFKRAVAGTIVSAGAVTKVAQFKRSIAGVLALTGTSARTNLIVIVSAVLSFAGTVTRKVMFKRGIAGILALAGAGIGVSGIKKTITGVLAMQGVARKMAIRAFRKGLNRFGFSGIFR